MSMSMKPEEKSPSTQNQNTSVNNLHKVTWTTSLARLFFTNDTSPDGEHLADLQRRACWVAIAILLQCINEGTFASIQAIKETSYPSFPFILKAFCTIAPVLLIIGSFFALWMACRPAPKQRKKKSVRPTRWQRITLVVSLGLACIGLVVCGISVAKCFWPLEFSNDGTVLDSNAASALLKGQNPYDQSKLSTLAQHHEDWTTPLRQGKFKTRLDYPTHEQLHQVLIDDLATGHAVEFETKVSYPAFAFLSLVPFVLVNYSNVLPLYLLSHMILVIAAWKFARPALRPWILLLAFANISMWTATAGETLDMLYIMFIGLTWLTDKQRWWSVLFLGLAIATKQIAWYFLPFYFLMIWQHYSLKEAVSRIIIAGSIGLLINIPFILWDPHSWYAGVIAPVGDPMFPLGTGLINLSIGHLLPYFAENVYKILEALAFVCALAYYWFRCRLHPEAALILAVIPLFFAWRSLPSYFYCSTFPLLAYLLARHNHLADVTKKLFPVVEEEKIHPNKAASARRSLAQMKSIPAIRDGNWKGHVFLSIVDGNPQLYRRLWLKRSL